MNQKWPIFATVFFQCTAAMDLYIDGDARKPATLGKPYFTGERKNCFGSKRPCPVKIRVASCSDMCAVLYHFANRLKCILISNTIINQLNKTKLSDILTYTMIKQYQ